MRILVTGGCGFTASHLVNHLVRTYPDYFVLNLDALEPCSSLANVEVGGAPNYAFVKGDLRSTDLLRHLMVQHRIDTVVHAAAHTHVDNSFGNSIAFTENNVLGTHALLEVARSCGVGRFIHVSTDEVYGSCGDERKDEGSVLAPTNPYSASKAAAEHVVRSYHISYGLPVIVVRGNNVYGPRQYPEKLIPNTIMRVARGLRPCLHGDGSNRRHYLHVDDVVAAYDVLLHRGAVGDVQHRLADRAHQRGGRAPRVGGDARRRRRAPSRPSTSRTASSTTCATTSRRTGCTRSAGARASTSTRASPRRSRGTARTRRATGRRSRAPCGRTRVDAAAGRPAGRGEGRPPPPLFGGFACGPQKYASLQAFYT